MAASPVASARFEAKFGALRQDRIHAEQLVIIFGGREQEDWKTLGQSVGALYLSLSLARCISLSEGG
eukprot:8169281-Prorocentrum_lima.AAC.1